MPILDAPGFAERLGAQAVGLFIVDEFILLQIVFDLTSQMQGDVRRVTGNVCVARRIRIPFWLTSSFDTIEKVTDVERRGIPADFLNRASRQQTGGTQDQLSTIARFNPTRFALESNRT